MNTTPQSEQRSQHRYFINSRGKKLLARYWKTEQSVSNVIVLPGYSEHSGRYQPLATQLNTAGCNVYSLDYEGHGKSDGLKGDVREFSYYVDDVQQYVQAIREDVDGPFWLFGHGMGALIVTLLAHRWREKDLISSVVLSNPLFKMGSEVPNIVQDTAKYVSTMAATFPILSIENEWLSADQKVLDTYSRDPLNYQGKLRARMAAHLVSKGKEAQDKVAELNVPVLLLQAKEDLFADPKVVSSWSENGRKMDQVYIELLDGRGHMQLFEKGWEELLDRIINWNGKLCRSVPESVGLEP